MSWDATFTTFDGRQFDWNYTHNTNKMIERACTMNWPLLPEGKSWINHLDGMSGIESWRFLRSLVTEMDINADELRELNPSNGWGDYDSLFTVLEEMLTVVSTCGEAPGAWAVSG